MTSNPVLGRRDYWPPELERLVRQVSYKPGWTINLGEEFADDGAGGLKLFIVSRTANSYDVSLTIRVRHEFLVPRASYNRDTWAAWLFDRVRDVESHEAGEFFMIGGAREFGPHHGNGEDPYRVWHVGDHADTRIKAGNDKGQSMIAGGRLFHDEYFATIVDRATNGRHHILVAASSYTAASNLQRELQMREGLPATAKFTWRNSGERIDLENGSRIVFTSTASTRIHGFSNDVVFLDSRAGGDYRDLAVVSLSASDQPELFEIDA